MENTDPLKPSPMSPLEGKENSTELVPVPATINFNESNSHSMRNIWLKEKIGFLNNLFGERKCKYCSLKKNECRCKRKSNRRSLLSAIELKSSSTQTSVQCKSAVPSAQRGCGVHLHFCIEPKVKKDHMINSSVQRCSNLGFNTNTEPNTPRQCCKCTSDPEPVLAKQSLMTSTTAETRISDSYQPKQEFTDHSIHEKEKSIFPKLFTENIVLHSKTVTAPFKKDNGENKIPEESRMKDNFQNEKETIHKNGSKMVEPENNIKKDSKMLEQHDVESKPKEKQPDVSIIRASILRKPTIYTEHKEHVFFPFTPDTRDEFKGALNACFESQGITGERLENISSNPKRSTFVRNSLINLRRERKQHVLEEKISIILMKLNSIEDKILELEKENICGTNEDITISCDSTKSTVSIEFGKHDKADGREQPTEMAAVTVTSPHERVGGKTIKVKSKGENVYINSNRNVSVKQFKRKPMSTNINPIVCFNPYELDAHSLASNSYLNSKNSKSKNQRVLIQCSTKNEKYTFCDKWRRISEELKISDPDIPN